MRTKTEKTENSRLPLFFKPLFWLYKFYAIDPDKHKKTVIVNTINYGDWEHWQWLLDYYGKANLKASIENIPASGFRLEALRLIKILLNIKKMKYASRGIKIKAEKIFEKLRYFSDFYLRCSYI